MTCPEPPRKPRPSIPMLGSYLIPRLMCSWFPNQSFHYLRNSFLTHILVPLAFLAFLLPWHHGRNSGWPSFFSSWCQRLWQCLSCPAVSPAGGKPILWEWVLCGVLLLPQSQTLMDNRKRGTDYEHLPCLPLLLSSFFEVEQKRLDTQGIFRKQAYWLQSLEVSLT